MTQRLASVGFATFLLAACAGTPATPEQLRLGEERLLQPFLQLAEVGCSELEIEITGNFHPNVGQPALDRATQTLTREHVDSCRQAIWTNTTGDPSRAFVLTIGQPPEFTDRGVELRKQTVFRVVNQVRLRVHEDRRPLQLDVHATGDVVLVRAVGDKALREVRDLWVSDGVAKTR